MSSNNQDDDMATSPKDGVDDQANTDRPEGDDSCDQAVVSSSSNPSDSTGKSSNSAAPAAKRKVHRRNKPYRSKKPKDMPRRPLSAYNIFFKEGRTRLLAEAKEAQSSESSSLGFESMAKTIAKRWRELSDEEKEPFKKKAQRDMERYRREMEDYQSALARKSREEREKAALTSQTGTSEGVLPPQVAGFQQGGVFLSQYLAQCLGGPPSQQVPATGFAGGVGQQQFAPVAQYGLAPNQAAASTQARQSTQDEYAASVARLSSLFRSGPTAVSRQETTSTADSVVESTANVDNTPQGNSGFEIYGDSQRYSNQVSQIHATDATAQQQVMSQVQQQPSANDYISQVVRLLSMQNTVNSIPNHQGQSQVESTAGPGYEWKEDEDKS